MDFTKKKYFYNCQIKKKSYFILPLNDKESEYEPVDCVQGRAASHPVCDGGEAGPHRPADCAVCREHDGAADVSTARPADAGAGSTAGAGAGRTATAARTGHAGTAEPAAGAGRSSGSWHWQFSRPLCSS